MRLWDTIIRNANVLDGSGDPPEITFLPRYFSTCDGLDRQDLQIEAAH
jgi:hypothetical protein